MRTNPSFPVKSPLRATVRDVTAHENGRRAKTAAPKVTLNPLQQAERRRLAEETASRARLVRERKCPDETQVNQEPSSLVPQIIGGQLWHLARDHAGSNGKASDRQTGITVEKGLLALAYVISGVITLVFGADLLTGWPFDLHSLSMDITYLASGVLLAYLTRHAHQELR